MKLFTRPKYKNRKVEHDGYTFDSLAERDRYLVLKEMERAGAIRDLVVKPAYLLQVNGVKIFDRPFHPDFAYEWIVCPACDSASHLPVSYVVEDVKGYLDPSDAATRIFKVCCRLMLAIHGIEVRIVQTEKTIAQQERRKSKQKTDRQLIRKLTAEKDKQ